MSKCTGKNEQSHEIVLETCPSTAWAEAFKIERDAERQIAAKGALEMEWAQTKNREKSLRTAGCGAMKGGNRDGGEYEQNWII